MSNPKEKEAGTVMFNKITGIFMSVGMAVAALSLLGLLASRFNESALQSQTLKKVEQIDRNLTELLVWKKRQAEWRHGVEISLSQLSEAREDFREFSVSPRFDATDFEVGAAKIRLEIAELEKRLIALEQRQ